MSDGKRTDEGAYIPEEWEYIFWLAWHKENHLRNKRANVNRGAAMRNGGKHVTFPGGGRRFTKTLGG